MPIYKLYSKRVNPNTGTYTYSDIPNKLRIQIQYIICDFIEKNKLGDRSEPFWGLIYEVLTREHGKPNLSWDCTAKYSSQVLNYLNEEKEIDKVLDIVEATFKCISEYEHIFKSIKPKDVKYYTPEEVVNDLNCRFKENGMGYKFESGKIIKIDNELLHANIAKQTPHDLTYHDYKTIDDELSKANEHFGLGNYRESIERCSNAFELALNLICKATGLNSTQSASKEIIQLLFDNGYIPAYLHAQLETLIRSSESIAYSIRDKRTEEKEATVIEVDIEIASYILNLTGSTIKFLLGMINK